MRARWLYLSLALLSACTDALIVYERDGGGTDASPVDAGDRDAPMDVGPPDAGDPCRVTQDLEGIPEGCVLSRPPPRPLCDEPGDLPTFEVGFLEPDFAASVGYDLDGHCTASFGAVTSCTNDLGTIPDTAMGGTDNAFGLIVMEGLRIAAPTIDAEFGRSARERGVGVPMVRVEGWNGLANDPRVRVTFAVGADLASEPPDWASGDVEVLPANGFFNGAGDPLARDLSAYVSESRLVVTIPDALPFDFVAEGRRLSIALRDARLVIGLTPGVGLDDFTVYGRWSVAEARAAVELLAPCPADAPLRASALNLLTRAADVRADRSEDGAMLACDALSLALRFTGAHTIRWGAPVPIDLDPMCM